MSPLFIAYFPHLSPCVAEKKKQKNSARLKSWYENIC